MTIQPLARLQSTAPAAGRHEQRVVLKGEYRGGPGLRNGPPRPVSRPNAPLAGGSQYLLPSSSRLGFCSAVRSGGGRRCWDVGALEGKSRKLSMTHPDRVPSLRVLVVGDAGAQRVGAETALPSFQG